MRRLIVAIVVLVLGVIGCSMSPSVAPSSPISSGQPRTTGAPTAAASASSNPLTFGDGEHRVGDEVQPGTYRAIAPRTGDGFCIWERVSGFGGTEAETIASAAGVGPRVVTIADTDAGFISDDCGTWSSELTPLTSEIADGVWLVGVDLQPGRYSSEAGRACVWQRLSGFGGTDAESLEVGLSGIAEIMATDRGFSSSNCGAWVAAPN